MKKAYTVELFEYICPNCGSKLCTDHPELYHFCPSCDAPIPDPDATRPEVKTNLLADTEDVVSYCNRRIAALAEHRNSLKDMFKSGAISSSSCEVGLTSDAAVISELRCLISYMGGEFEDFDV